MIASHLLSKYRGSFSACLINLHDASPSWLRFLECYLSRQYHVRKPVNLLSNFLILMHALNLFIFRPPNSFLDCIHPSVFLQNVCISWMQLTTKAAEETSILSSPHAYLPSHSRLHSKHTKDREIVLNYNNNNSFHNEFVTILKLKA